MAIDRDARLLHSSRVQYDAFLRAVNAVASSQVTRIAAARIAALDITNWNTAYGWGDHAGLYELTFSKNTAFNKNFGALVDTVCQGNDARLSDARTPTAHTHPWGEITSQPTTLAGTVNTSGDQSVAGVKRFTSELGIGTHFEAFAANTDSMALRSSNAGAVGVALRNSADANYGYLYAQSTGIGFLNNVAAWSVRFDNDGAMTVGTIPWARLTSVPATFAPSAHTHLWADLTDKPATFAPSAHTHPWSEITSQPTTLSGTVNLTGDQTVAGVKRFSNELGIGSHFEAFAANTDSMALRSSNAGAVGVALRNSADANYGFLYAMATGIGFLNNAAAWSVRFDNTGAMTIGTVPWARLSDVPTSLSNTVNLTGNQTVAGVKTFSDEAVLSSVRVDTSTGPRIVSGTGTPEAVVTAPVGSLYLRSDGGAGSTLYVKETGTGNTGWAAK